MDLGRGVVDVPSGAYHFMAISGEGADAVKTPQEVLDAMQNSANRCFSRAIWNPNVIAVPRPHNEQSFILLSAGPDGVFGNSDDIANFEINR
jgi:hypothetical protein